MHGQNFITLVKFLGILSKVTQVSYQLTKLILIVPLIIVLKMLSAFMSAAYIQVHFRLDFFMEANNMNPDQTAAWKQSDLGPYCSH